jgi:hypothetical protein
MREDLIVKVEGQRGKRSGVLEELGIARSTYYKWSEGYSGWLRLRHLGFEYGTG